MSKQLFINLAVKDCERSMNLYQSIGFVNNPQFSDETGKCMVWSDSIYVMLLSYEKFKQFTDKPLADTKNAIAGLFSLSMESIDAMNQFMQNGLNSGGTEPHPLRDLGFMQQRSLEDFDGHTWEVFYMDMSQIPNE